MGNLRKGGAKEKHDTRIRSLSEIENLFVGDGPLRRLARWDEYAGGEPKRRGDPLWLQKAVLASLGFRSPPFVLFVLAFGFGFG